MVSAQMAINLVYDQKYRPRCLYFIVSDSLVFVLNIFVLVYMVGYRSVSLLGPKLHFTKATSPHLRLPHLHHTATVRVTRAMDPFTHSLIFL